MEKRLKLHEILVEFLGSNNVYFQPPETIKLKYPCILYKKATPKTKCADDNTYIFRQQYTVTIIYNDPDTDLAKRLVEYLPMCSIDRTFSADNLYHDILTLYY